MLRLSCGLVLAATAACAPGGAAIDHDSAAASLRYAHARAPGTDFRLMTYNIKGASGCNPAACIDPQIWDIADVILAEAPDIVSIQEIGQWTSGDTTAYPPEPLLYEDQVRTLAELTGMPYYAFSAHKDYANQIDKQVFLDYNGLSSQGGVAILSAYPFVGEPEVLHMPRDPRNEFLEPGDAWEYNRSAVLRVTVELPVGSGTMLTDVIAAHLFSAKQLRRIEQSHDIDRMAHPTRPAFLMGDMNEPFATLGTVTPGWHNPLATEILTYPSWGPTKQIDYTLYRNIQDLDVLAHFTAGGTLSDHQAWGLDLAVAAQCPAFDTASPHVAFCSHATCAACSHGQGDCDSSAQCAPGLHCVANAGAGHGLPATYDVCEIPAATHAIPGVVDTADHGTAGPASVYPEERLFHVSVAQDQTFGVIVDYATNQAEGTRWAFLEVDGKRVGRVLHLRDTGGWGSDPGHWYKLKFRHIPLFAGDHVVRLVLSGDGVNIDDAELVVAADGPFGKIAHSMPAWIQAEHYDVGGYHDTTPGNAGGELRTDDVDVFTKTSHLQPEGGRRVVLAPDEWLEYTVDVKETDVFSMEIRYATAFDPVTVQVDIDGADQTGPVAMPRTFIVGTPAYDSVVIPDLSFTAGERVVRVTASNGISLDFIRFYKDWGGHARNGAAWQVPGLIQAEHYDFAGYSDSTPGNAGSTLRWDDVDVDFGATGIENEYFVFGTAAGEWLEYTIDVLNGALPYDIDVRYATPNSTGQVRFQLDGSWLGPAITLPSTGGWGGNGSNWARITALGNVQLTQGTHVLRVHIPTGGWNLDSIDIYP